MWRGAADMSSEQPPYCPWFKDQPLARGQRPQSLAGHLFFMFLIPVPAAVLAYFYMLPGIVILPFADGIRIKSLLLLPFSLVALPFLIVIPFVVAGEESAL